MKKLDKCESAYLHALYDIENAIPRLQHINPICEEAYRKARQEVTDYLNVLRSKTEKKDDASVT